MTANEFVAAKPFKVTLQPTHRDLADRLSAIERELVALTRVVLRIGDVVDALHDKAFRNADPTPEELEEMLEHGPDRLQVG